MKKIFIVIIFLLSVSLAFSQDLILTSRGDSLNCKITKIDRDYIYFTFKYENEIRNSLLPISDVTEHQINYFEEAEVPAESVVGFVNYKRMRLGINAGYSYVTARISNSVPSEFEDYVRKLKSGYHVGADIDFFVNERLGFGVKGLYFNSSNSLDNIYITDAQGNTRNGKMSDNIKTFFVGPSFISRMTSANNRGALIMNLSLGYLGYKDDKIVVDSYMITGSTLGMALDIGYDFTLSENWSLGLQISSLVGTLSQYTVDDGTTVETIELDKDEYESLGRLDFSIGLRYNFWVRKLKP